jgi:RNA polymerase subunit RPABC4/transcription elongation factor Spt4
MAMTNCVECGKEISNSAKVCPHCGKKNPAPITKQKWIGFIVLLIAVIWIYNAATKHTDTSISGISSSTRNKENDVSQSESKKSSNNYKMGQSVSIGYTSYAVWKAYWSDKLSDNEFMNEAPNATYLFIKLTVRNDDKKARTIPPFKLYDENGAEYETTSKSWSVEGSIGMLEDLNPSVQKTGLIVFDVPKNHNYKLKVSGGYWSSDEAFIIIKTK